MVLLCAAGIVASVIARDSRELQGTVFRDFVKDHDSPRALHRLDGAKRLNPDSSIAIAQSRFAQGKRDVQILQRAVGREPENAVLWVRLAQHQVTHGDKAGGQRSYTRARQLDPQLPKVGPPPGD